MKENIISFNIVLKKQDLSPSSIELDSVKSIIQEVFKEYTQAPIISQFPEILWFLVENKQITISYQQNTIIVADSSTNSVQHDLDTFINLVKSVEKNAKNAPLTAYGFNYSLQLELEHNDTSVLKDFLNKEKLKEKKLMDGKLVSGAIKIINSFNGYRTELNLTPILTKDYKDSKIIKLDSNYHWDSDNLPEIKALTDSFSKNYNKLLATVNTLDINTKA